jgi:hypothetical protein
MIVLNKSHVNFGGLKLLMLTCFEEETATIAEDSRLMIITPGSCVRINFTSVPSLLLRETQRPSSVIIYFHPPPCERPTALLTEEAQTSKGVWP